MGNKLVLIGGGGHCKSVLDSALALEKYEKIVITDFSYPVGSRIMGVEVVGDDSCLERLKADGFTDAFITVGSVGDTAIRRKIYSNIKKIGFNIPNIIDRTAVVSSHANLSNGIFVGKNAVINAEAKIGDNSIINTAAVVEHECVIGQFVHISPKAVLCGNVTVGDNSHIGANSVVRQQIIIGNDVMIGAGSVVVKNMLNNAKAFGNPCREVIK